MELIHMYAYVWSSRSVVPSLYLQWKLIIHHKHPIFMFCIAWQSADWSWFLKMLQLMNSARVCLY